MHATGTILTLAALVACSWAASDFNCTGTAEYSWPRSDSCWKYYKCNNGSTTPSFGWCFPLFRRFNPVSKECEWCWHVDCGANPGPVPTPSPVPPTPPPTTTVPPPVTPPTPKPMKEVDSDKLQNDEPQDSPQNEDLPKKEDSPNDKTSDDLKPAKN